MMAYINSVIISVHKSTSLTIGTFLSGMYFDFLSNLATDLIYLQLTGQILMIISFIISIILGTISLTRIIKTWLKNKKTKK